MGFLIYYVIGLVAVLLPARVGWRYYVAQQNKKAEARYNHEPSVGPPALALAGLCAAFAALAWPAVIVIALFATVIGADFTKKDSEK
nr:hypothetical protein [Rhodococcus sp. (in: high G+C Gram-positive bacteria)]